MKRILVLCLLFCVGCNYGVVESSPLSIKSNPDGSKTLFWDAPTTNDNVGNTPLTDLAGYHVYFGTETRDYSSGGINVGNITNWDFSFNPGTYFFAVTAYDESGNESGFSNEASTEVGSPLPVLADPVIEVEWRDNERDTLIITILVPDPTAPKSTVLPIDLNVSRGSLIALDSAQVDINDVTSGSWPVVGTVYYTSNSVHFWDSDSLNNIVSHLSTNTLYAINARLHEKNEDWFGWPRPVKYFKMIAITIGGNIIEEKIRIDIILDNIK